MPRSGFPLILVAILPLATPLAGPAAAREPLELVPAEAMLSWSGRPFPDTKPLSEEPSALATLLDIGTRIAGKPLDARGQITVRLLEMLGAMVHYPYALAVIDARARPGETNPESRKLDKLKMLVAVKTDGKSEPLLRIIQKVVNEQTSSAEATLEQQQAERWSYQRLRDKRLPDWCIVSWGQIDDLFVLTLGENAWAEVAETAAGRRPSLAEQDWVRQVRERRRDALIEIIFAARSMRERLDPFVQGRASDFFAAWDAMELTQAHWALGFEKNALYCVAHFRDGEVLRERVYADPGIRRPDLLATVPPDARYAIHKLDLRQWIPRLLKGFFATRGQEDMRLAIRQWERLQAERGLNADEDVLAHLGPHVVMHNVPQHPLRLPLAFTMLVEIRDEPARTRAGLEKVFEIWQQVLTEAAERSGKPSAVRLERDPEGVWSLQFGMIGGPAWVVTDRFIVSSWSPLALREYLSIAGDKVGRR